MQLYSTREAAAYLGISYDSLKQHVRQGNIRPDHRLPTALLFTRRTLDRAGIVPKLRRRDITEAMRKEIARRWWAGEAQGPLAREFDVSVSFVMKLARQYAPEGADASKRPRRGRNGKEAG